MIENFLSGWRDNFNAVFALIPLTVIAALVGPLDWSFILAYAAIVCIAGGLKWGWLALRKRTLP